MVTILTILSSPRGKVSFSTKLAHAIVSKIKEQEIKFKVVEHDLNIEALPPMSSVHLGAFYTPLKNEVNVRASFLPTTKNPIEEIKSADIIVIGVGLYNYHIPSTLKVWIDHICRAGFTFKYDENGRQIGLVTGKKVYIAMATGGIYSKGPLKEKDFATPYLKYVLGSIGLTDVTIVRVEGLGKLSLQDAAFVKAVKGIKL